MGAKLSKKKKGYCLGAGKDGESIETEVEQKETETQAGQKDAAEPNGEKKPTDQTLNNHASEEPKSQAEKNSTEVASGETTKDDLNKDQKSESKPSSEQKKVEEPNKEQDKPEHTKTSNATRQTAPEGGEKVKSPTDEKIQTDHDKEKESAAKNEPTQEPKPVKEQESSEPKEQNQSGPEHSVAIPEQKEELAKPVPDPETKVEVEKMEKEQTPVTTKEHISEQVTKEPALLPDSVKEIEKPTEIVKPLVSETASLAPELQKPVTVPVVEPENANKVVESDVTKVSLPETVPATELVKPKPDLAPETIKKSVESKLSEEPVAPVPEVENVETVADPELVPCPESEQLSETKQKMESLPKPLPSKEVPDLTAELEENVKNPETLDNGDLGKESVETQEATTESAPAEQPSAGKNLEHDATVAENHPSEQAVEDIQENKAQDTISTEQEMQKKGKEEESVSDKPPTEHGSLQKDCKDTEKAALDTSKNENDQAVSEDPTAHNATQDKNPADKAENHETPAEEISNEPSAPLIIEKHGVSNGLPLKEEVKVHLENGCDKDIHELNGQGDRHEIEVCNE